MLRFAILTSLALSAPALAADTPVDDEATDEGLVPTGRDKPAQRPRVEPTPTTPELAKPEVSPEAKRTVEAFEGNWELAGMATDEAGNPVQVTTAVECKEIVEGAAVACDSVTVMPDGTHLMEHVVYGVEPVTNEIKRVTISKAGIQEDTGKWTGDQLVITAEPLGDEPVKSTTFVIKDDGTLTERTVRKTAQGEELVRDVTGKRDVSDDANELPMNDRELEKEPTMEPMRDRAPNPMRR